MHPFREVKVWDKSHQLGLHVYRITASFPEPEQGGLVRHLRKAAISIPSKIAEGCGRHGDRELTRYLESAKGSATDLEYQILLAYELGFLSEADQVALSAEVMEVQKMLYAFIKTVRGRVLTKNAGAVTSSTVTSASELPVGVTDL